jgi:hypothetical protein
VGLLLLEWVPRTSNTYCWFEESIHCKRFTNFWRILCSFISSTYTQSSIVHDVQKENKINYFARMVKLTITKTLSKRNILYIPCMFVSRKLKHCCCCKYCVSCLDVFIIKRRIEYCKKTYCSNTLFVWVTKPVKTQGDTKHRTHHNIRINKIFYLLLRI